jgi:DNA-directed RNA polymerase specialized sigma24 family protein
MPPTSALAPIGHPTTPSDSTWNALSLQLYSRRLPAVLQCEQADLVAESLSRAWAHPPPDGHWAPWLNRIFTNLAFDRLRHRSRSALACKSLGLAPGAVSRSAEDDAIASEQRRHIGRAVQDLPVSLRDAVTTQFLCEPEEAQNLVGSVNHNTHRVRVHRGLQRLRASLSAVRAVFFPSFYQHASLVVGLGCVALLSRANVTAKVTSLQIDSAWHVEDRHRAMIADAHVIAVERLATADAPVRLPSSPRVVTTAAKQEQVTVFDFGDDEISAEIVGPDVVLVQGESLSKQESLLEIPSTMLPSLLKSFEDL